jgi:aspartate aminotransferase
MSDTMKRIAINSSISGLEPSATLAINERSHQLIAEGKHVFKLGLGQSPFPVPAPVQDALRDHAGEKDYLAVQGLATLRADIAAWHQRRHGITGDAANIMVGPGSKELIFLLQMVHDSVLTIPAPSWVSYGPQARIIGKQVEWIDTQAKSGWRLDPAVLDNTCARAPNIRRLLILNYPNNPTGLTYNAHQLRALADVARKYGILVVSDEIYGEVNHDGSHVSLAQFYPEGTIITSGLSKWCGAGGWRLGYCHIPSSLESVMAAMCAVASETFTSVSAPIQHAARAAFAADPIIEDYLANSRRVLSGLGGWIAQTLRAGHISVDDPQGGFYVLPDFGALREGLERRQITTSPQLVEAILNETGVAFLPGTCFGRPATELTARISYVDFDGARALQVVQGLPLSDPIEEGTLTKICGPTVEAVHRIRDWCLKVQ